MKPKGCGAYEPRIALLKNEPDNADLRVSDFGTRRRFSRAWQEKVVRVLIDELGSPIFSGTSNVDLARRYGLVSIGHDGARVPAGLSGPGPAPS